MKFQLSYGLAVLTTGVMLLGAGCGETWIGFYYPNKADLTISTRSPELASLEECRSWVEAQRSYRGTRDEEDDYECGKQCRYDKEWDGYVCKETVR